VPHTTCADCGGVLEEGFVCDESYSTVKPSEWVEGLPEPSVWTGVRLRGKTRLPMRAFRCIDCGLVRLYADAPDDPARGELQRRLERLEEELQRMADREEFLLELLRERGSDVPKLPGADPGREGQ
jgi:hypothetical protein